MMGHRRGHGLRLDSVNTVKRLYKGIVRTVTVTVTTLNDRGSLFLALGSRLLALGGNDVY